MDNLKSMIQIWINLGRQFGVHPRTLMTFERRAECEGRQFLYQDLSQLGRDFDRFLIGGEPFNTTARFRRVKGACYPKFMSELFKLCMDKEGNINLDMPAQTIKRIRQLLLLYYKVKVPHHEDDIQKAINSFMERDKGLCRPLPPKESTRKARKLLGRLLDGLDPFQSRPRHGSGATACRTPNHDKYHSFRFLPRLHEAFPYEEFFFYNFTHLCDSLESLLDAEVVAEPSARIVAVPKDMRGPRLICCEPREHQYIQQGLMRDLYDRVENHPLTSGFVNFTNQEVNRDLTLEASENQEWCTLDLKDASDRVRWDLVRELFPGDWVRALDACRTRFVDVGGGKLFGPLRKFAPMGSAVCFPIEALVFWSLLYSHLNASSHRKCDVYVYGDDIILPTARAEEAISLLEVYDLKVNVQKSCYRTPFRESCGIDCWMGHDVSYVKARMEFDSSTLSETSWVEFVNNISTQYGWTVGHLIRSIVDEVFGPHYCTTSGAALTYECKPRASNNAFFKHRWNPDLHRVEALIPCITTAQTVCRDSEEFHWNEILRSRLTGWSDNYTIGSYAEPNRSHKKYRWRPIL
jgi:hypothetical protein